MQIVVFGATGSLGTHIIQQALAAGHDVTAFTRRPQQVSALGTDKLHIFEGDVFNLRDVENAVNGKDAVFCALGDGTKGKVRAAGTRNIIEAMRKQRCERLICQTTLGLGDSWNNLNFLWKYIMFGFLLKKAYRDHAWQEKYIVESRLDYTIVRPSAFTDGPVTRQYRVHFSAQERNLKLKISRADVADFMLQQLNSDQFRRQVVSISH
jgi:uncharacterized protein YbjT (DUF2867 family)